MNLPDQLNLAQSLQLSQGKALRTRTRRWFFYSLIGLFIFLCGGIVLAAVLLLRRGKLPRQGIVAGSSMEPIFAGPRFAWTCTHCSNEIEFALDSCKSHQPFRCSVCNFLDSESDVDLDDPDLIADRILPGASLRFATLRSIRPSRAADIALGLAHSSGLRRGEVVVLQDALRSNREIKRIVGFPEEEIAIREGDIFVNGSRWSKSLEQTLRQAILLNWWDGARSLEQQKGGLHHDGTWRMAGQNFTGVIEAADEAKPDNASKRKEGGPYDAISRNLVFSYSPPREIDNRVAINAHDSHSIVPVNDVGIAWQLTELASSWMIRCKFQNGNNVLKVDLSKKGSQLEFRCGDKSSTAEMPETKETSIWIVLAIVDGFLVAGNQDEEWLRIELPQPELQDPSVIHLAPIAIEPMQGKMTIDQLLVFRDIHYRGYGDTESQLWLPESQAIVLGDNVSISSDSRDRWPQGLPFSAIKGLVLQPESPIEALLRQR